MFTNANKKSRANTLLGNGESPAPKDLKKRAPQGSPSLGLGRVSGDDAFRFALARHAELVSGQRKSSPLGTAVPLYDQGGDVLVGQGGQGDPDVSDGKHQLAVLEDGERVLTPQETQQYEAEHGEGKGPQMLVPISDEPRMSAGIPAVPGYAPQAPSAFGSATATDSKAGARQKVENPGAQTVAPTQVPDQLVPRDTAAEGPSVFQTRKEEAAQKGDLVKLGAAILGEKLVAPTTTSDVTGEITPRATSAFGTAQPREFHQDNAGGPLVSGAPTDYDKGTVRDFSQMEYQARLQQYDKAIQAAHDRGDERTAHEQMLAKRTFQDQNPWGSESNHPGIFGKIAHVASKVGSIAGDALIPSTVALVPGTDFNRRLQEGALGSAINRDVESEEKDADTQQKIAAAKAALANNKLAGQLLLKGYVAKQDANGEYTLDQVPGFRDAPKDMQALLAPAVQAAQDRGVSPQDDPTVQQIMSVMNQTKPQTAKEDQAYLSTVTKVASNPKYADKVDPKQLDATLTAARKDGTISTGEYAAAKAWQAAHPDAATKVVVSGIEGDEALDRHFAGRQVVYNGAQMSWGDAKAQGANPADVEILSPTTSQKNEDKLTSANAYTQVLAKYERDLNSANLNAKDRAALGVLTSHEAETTSSVGALLENLGPGAVSDILLGQPTTGYSKKLMGASMTKDQYDALSTDGKKLVSDYFTAIIANFADMKNQIGSVGRNPMQLQAEINTIPLPYLDKESANVQFQNKKDDLKNRYANIPHIKGKPYPFEQARPQKGDTKQYGGFTYEFDGTQWKKQ